MNREYYLELARSGLRMPIGTDLVLHEKPDAKAIAVDGKRLGRVIVEGAHRYRTPLAMPLMDLTREKGALLGLLGIEASPDDFHFQEVPDSAAMQRFERGLGGPLAGSVEATVESVRHVARGTNLVPLGISIGPFSLATKLLADPITPVFLAGTGATADDEPEVKLLEMAVEISTRLILRVIERQIEAGAKMIVIAEPAANQVFFSPSQMESGADIFERFAMAPNRRVRGLLKEAGVELFFHCCGELVDPMVSAFATLDAAILSLGSSRMLWHDAELVPKSTILYGNLPSKQFYSDSLVTIADVGRRASELLGRMKDVRHPFILGTECDVLSVPGCESCIKSKVDALMAAD